MNPNTHIALCDIAMFAHIPNLIYLAPTTKVESIYKCLNMQLPRNTIELQSESHRKRHQSQEYITHYSIHNKSQIV